VGGLADSGALTAVAELDGALTHGTLTAAGGGGAAAADGATAATNESADGAGTHPAFSASATHAGGSAAAGDADADAARSVAAFRFLGLMGVGAKGSVVLGRWAFESRSRIAAFAFLFFDAFGVLFWGMLVVGMGEVAKVERGGGERWYPSLAAGPLRGAVLLVLKPRVDLVG